MPGPLLRKKRKAHPATPVSTIPPSLPTCLSPILKSQHCPVAHPLPFHTRSFNLCRRHHRPGRRRPHRMRCRPRRGNWAGAPATNPNPISSAQGVHRVIVLACTAARRRRRRRAPSRATHSPTAPCHRHLIFLVAPRHRLSHGLTERRNPHYRPRP